MKYLVIFILFLFQNLSYSKEVEGCFDQLKLLKSEIIIEYSGERIDEKDKKLFTGAIENVYNLPTLVD